eukprot:Lankesteria_metandrocarpae@DN1443_c0_g1_i1.p1
MEVDMEFDNCTGNAIITKSSDYVWSGDLESTNRNPLTSIDTTCGRLATTDTVCAEVGGKMDTGGIEGCTDMTTDSGSSEKLVSEWMRKTRGGELPWCARKLMLRFFCQQADISATTTSGSSSEREQLRLLKFFEAMSVPYDPYISLAHCMPDNINAWQPAIMPRIFLKELRSRCSPISLPGPPQSDLFGIVFDRLLPGWAVELPTPSIELNASTASSEWGGRLSSDNDLCFLFVNNGIPSVPNNINGMSISSNTTTTGGMHQQLNPDKHQQPQQLFGGQQINDTTTSSNTISVQNYQGDAVIKSSRANAVRAAWETSHYVFFTPDLSRTTLDKVLDHAKRFQDTYIPQDILMAASTVAVQQYLTTKIQTCRGNQKAFRATHRAETLDLALRLSRVFRRPTTDTATDVLQSTAGSDVLQYCADNFNGQCVAGGITDWQCMSQYLEGNDYVGASTNGEDSYSQGVPLTFDILGSYILGNDPPVDDIRTANYIQVDRKRRAHIVTTSSCSSDGGGCVMTAAVVGGDETIAAAACSDDRATCLDKSNSNDTVAVQENMSNIKCSSEQLCKDTEETTADRPTTTVQHHCIPPLHSTTVDATPLLTACVHHGAADGHTETRAVEGLHPHVKHEATNVLYEAGSVKSRTADLFVQGTNKVKSDTDSKLLMPQLNDSCPNNTATTDALPDTAVATGIAATGTAATGTAAESGTATKSNTAADIAVGLDVLPSEPAATILGVTRADGNQNTTATLGAYVGGMPSAAAGAFPSSTTGTRGLIATTGTGTTGTGTTGTGTT